MISQKNPDLGFSMKDQEKPFLNSSVMTEFEKLAIMEALDHLFVTKKYQEVGSCILCRKISSKGCSCGTFYCSSECQNSDWQTHKTVCNQYQINGSNDNTAFSVNTPIVESCDETEEHNDKENFLKVRNQGAADSVSPFKALANQVTNKINKSCDISEEHKPVSNFNRLPNHNQNQQQYFNGKNEAKRFSSGGKGDVRKLYLSNDQKKTFLHKKVFNNIEYKNSKSECHSVKNESCEHGSERSVLSKILPQNKRLSSSSLNSKPKQEVTCTHRESSIRYWVLNVDDLPLYEKIQTTLAKECENYESIQPKVGFICGCNYANEWYRGKIVSVVPKLMVHFIDYGNTSEYDYGVVKKLPPHLRSSDGLAFLIEFEEGTPEEYKIEDLHSLKLTVKETRKAADGVICVKITKGILGVTNTVADDSENEISMAGMKNIERSVVDCLTVSSRGMILFSPSEETMRFGSVVPDNVADAKECIKETIQFDTSKSYPKEAKVGDYVLVSDLEGNDYRGKVLCKLENTYYVQTIDCGNVVVTESVFEMPNHGKDLIRLSGLITMTNILSKNAVSKVCNCLFDITSEAKAGKWPCLLKDYSDQKPVAEGFIEKVPETFEADPQYAPLKSGSIVELCNLVSSNSAYVRAIDSKTNEKIQEINGIIREHIINAKNFKFPLTVGSLCCAKFDEDQLFYRGQVESVIDNKVNVMFVDFGNIQETDLKNVKPVPDSLKKVPFFAVKVELAKVSRKPCSKATKEYVERLISEGTELILSFQKSITGGVTLKELVSGASVNNIIENGNSEKPRSDNSMVQTMKSEKFFVDEDLKYTKLVTGTKCELFILHVNELDFEKTCSFWATDGSSKNLLNVFESLNSKITEYCEKVKTPYRPKERELCLALYDGGWYRALTIEKVQEDKYTVFFLDFGNICVVTPECIRNIKAEFIEDPILAVNCILKGHQRIKRNPSLFTKIFKMLEENTNLTFSNVEVLECTNDSFMVVIPEVEKLLSA